MNLSLITALNAASVALALSDGTPVDFVKITSKDNIQVRVPTTHDLGDDPLRIFRRDGTHYKNKTDLTLVATSAAAPAAAPAPAAGVTYLVGDAAFASLDDAKAEAIDLFRDSGETIAIFKQEIVGSVGFSLAA